MFESAQLAKSSKQYPTATSYLTRLRAAKVTDELAAGRGTVGKLLRDDELYRKMLDLVAGLQSSADELKALVIQWREQGIKVKF